MSGALFEDQGGFGRDEALNLTALLIKWRIASTRQQAQYILIGVVLVAIVLAFFIYHVATPSHTGLPAAQMGQFRQPLPGTLPAVQSSQ
jgi:hypothetical protein